MLGELNPALRVPTLLLDDGRPLAESNAILWYFGDGTRFVPDDRYERTQVLQWQFFEQYDHEPALAVVRFWLAYSGEPEAYVDRIEGRRAAGYRALDAMERHLAGRSWLVGDGMTLADISLYAYTHVAARGRIRPLDGTRRSAPGSTGSRASRGTSRSTPERFRRRWSGALRHPAGPCGAIGTDLWRSRFRRVAPSELASWNASPRDQEAGSDAPEGGDAVGNRRRWSSG